MLNPPVGTKWAYSSKNLVWGGNTSAERPVLRLTVDTSLIYGDRLARIRAASEGLGVDIKPTTVTHREHTRAHLAFPTEPIDESGSTTSHATTRE